MNITAWRGPALAERADDFASERLTMRCTIQRAAVTGEDAYGADIYGDPADYLTNLPCWFQAATGPGETFAPERDIVAGGAVLLVPRDTDLTTSDTVVTITQTLADGTVLAVEAGPLNITDTQWWSTYRLLTVSKVA